MFKFPKKKSGFTLIELLIVIAIIVILVAIVVPVIMNARRNARHNNAKMAMNSIQVALKQYLDDFGSYPPDDDPSTNGSEQLWYYLCRKMSHGEMFYGPYLEVKEDRLKVGQGDNKMLISPLGTEYEYHTQKDESPNGDPKKILDCLAIDRGEDNLLGGSYDGGVFTPTDDDMNNDGKADSDDNIYSTPIRPRAPKG